MSSPTEFVEEVLASVPELKEIYNEHITDHDVLLPHVFFGDVTRFAIAEAEKEETSSALVRLLSVLELGLVKENEQIAELIAVSFVENLCGEDAAMRSLKRLMGPKLTKELETICGQ